MPSDSLSEAVAGDSLEVTGVRGKKDSWCWKCDEHCAMCDVRCAMSDFGMVFKTSAIQHPKSDIFKA